MPSILVKQALVSAAERTLAADPGRLRWYRLGSSAAWLPSPEESDWHRIHRTVMLGDAVLGWCSASIDREAQTVTEVGAVSLQYSLPYARALDGWMHGLRREFRALRWTCVVGNPAAAGWRRWAERAGGGELCLLRRYALLDGRPVDVHLFEVLGEAP